MDISLIKAVQRSVGVSADGLVGPRTLVAMANALGCGKNVKDIQYDVGVNPDGKFGPATLGAVAKSLGVSSPQVFPAESDDALTRFYGEAGTNLAVYDLPYPLYMGEVVCKRITLNVRCAAAFLELFERIKEYYGMEKIKELGLDQYGGAYNKRRITGGIRWSTHAYGCAIDLDPDHNQLKWGRDRARFARPEYDYFWRVVDDLGLQGLGPAKNFDWMHVQACYRK